MQSLQNCIGPAIRIRREVLCLPYAGFFFGGFGQYFKKSKIGFVNVLLKSNFFFLGGGAFYANLLSLKNPNNPEYAQVLAVPWTKLNSVTVLLSPPPLDLGTAE